MLYAHGGLFCVYVRNVRSVPNNSGSFILHSLNMYMQKAFTCTCRKLFHNNSRQSGERGISHIKWYWGKKKKTPNKPSQKPTEDIRRPFFLFTFSVLEVKKHIHPKKNQSRHPSEGLHGCNCNPNSVFCIMFNLATCEIYGTMDYTEAGFIWPTLTM